MYFIIYPPSLIYILHIINNILMQQGGKYKSDHHSNISLGETPKKQNIARVENLYFIYIIFYTYYTLSDLGKHQTHRPSLGTSSSQRCGHRLVLVPDRFCSGAGSCLAFTAFGAAPVVTARHTWTTSLPPNGWKSGVNLETLIDSEQKR